VNCLGFQLFLENLLNIGLFLDISRELSDSKKGINTQVFRFRYSVWVDRQDYTGQLM
jgi:hypothetical protein